MGKKTPLKKTEKKSLPGKQAWLGILLVLAATWLIYQPSLKNKLTNWDDQEYITYNKDLADASFKKHFVEKPHVMGNFHPLTMLTLAWNYQSAFDPVTGETDPLPFHRTNMWLHIFNALLVYLFLYFLSGNNLVATHACRERCLGGRKKRCALLFILSGRIGKLGVFQKTRQRSCGLGAYRNAFSRGPVLESRYRYPSISIITLRLVYGKTGL
jgi:hypothetical protein